MRKNNNIFNVSEVICKYLEEMGIKYVFGVPGGSLEPFYSALLSREEAGGIIPIVARHEAGAAFMAGGYWKETGNLGVCCATTGPGATNMLTGVASAFQDNIPMLVITAQSSTKSFGKGAAQESSCSAIDTMSIYDSCTRYNSLISDVEQLPYKLHAAVCSALNPTSPGPAHLSIPINLFRSYASSFTATPSSNIVRPSLIKLVDENSISAFITRMMHAQFPVIYIGDSAIEAIPLIFQLAEILNIPIVSSPSGKGYINIHHKQYYGVFGMAGHDKAYEIVTSDKTDLIIAVGTTLDEVSTSGWNEQLLDHKKLIHVDQIIEHFHQSPMCSLHVLGNLAVVFTRALNHFSNSEKIYEVRSDTSSLNKAESLSKIHYQKRQYNLADEESCFSNLSPIKPQRLMYELSIRMPSGTRYLADIGNSFLWAIHYLQPSCQIADADSLSPNSTMSMGMGLASMGWAIGSSIGMALGDSCAPVVAITGDGSFLMSGQEITVAKQYNLAVIFVILNDSALGTVKHGQKLGKAVEGAYELPIVNYKEVSKALGIRSYRIESAEDFDNIDFINISGPLILDVLIDPDETPPLASRIKVLGWEMDRKN